MRHKHKHHKKKQRLFDIESGSTRFNNGLDTFDAENIPDFIHNLPDNNNHHNDDDEDHSHLHPNIPPPGVIWSRDKSFAVAGAALGSVAAGSALLYGLNAGNNISEVENLGDIELNVTQPSEFVENNNNFGGEETEPLYGEDEYDPGLDEGFEDVGDGDIPMQEFTNNDTSIVENPEYEPGDLTNEIENELNDMEDVSLDNAVENAPEEEGFVDEAIQGIKGFWDYLTGAAGDVAEVAANLPEISGAAAQEAGASEAVVEGVEAVATIDEVAAAFGGL